MDSLEFYKQYTLKMSVFPIALMYDVFTNKIKKYAGTTQKIVIADFEKGTSRGFFVRKDFLECGDKIAEKIILGKLPLKKIISDYEKADKKLLILSKKINSMDLTELNNSELNQLFQEYHKAYSDAYVPASIPFLCDFSLERIASKQMKKEVGFSKATKLISVLSAPEGFSWETKHKLELAKLALKAKKKKINSLNKFRKSKFQKEFEKHFKEWKWLPYDYQNRPMTRKTFERMLKEVIIFPEKIIKEINDSKKKTEKEKKKALKLAGKSKGAKNALLLGELAYFKEYRKGLMSKSLYLMEPLLREIAVRTGIKLKEARFFLPEELNSVLNNPKKWKKELEKRWKYSVFVQNGLKRSVFSGRNARTFMSKLILEKPNEQIKGTVACVGKVIGKARIIFKPKDLYKMEEGDILVSPMTTPDLIPAIKKASAIVTDTGGMTSHAAIVSREFNIPCIIGTQHATQILKDGDLIEVDATKGIIKKLK